MPARVKYCAITTAVLGVSVIAWLDWRWSRAEVTAESTIRRPCRLLGGACRARLLLSVCGPISEEHPMLRMLLDRRLLCFVLVVTLALADTSAVRAQPAATRAAPAPAQQPAAKDT